MQTIIKIALWMVALTAAFSACESGDIGGLTPSGKAGSMTRFALAGDYLYVVGSQELQTFRIANNNFELVNEMNAGQGMETIFVQGNYLYLGAASAMYIYSIEQPEQPRFMFQYNHITSCDPVVVQDNRAYVTLRSGTTCNGSTNVLQILDITDRLNPWLVTSITMQSPYGLAVDGKALFVCEGEHGLKVFDITDEKNLRVISNINTHHAYDVIAHDGVILVTGNDGLFQYSYAPSGLLLEQLSKIPVTPAP